MDNYFNIANSGISTHKKSKSNDSNKLEIF